jgi:GntR family transcriptional regulator
LNVSLDCLNDERLASRGYFEGEHAMSFQIAEAQSPAFAGPLYVQVAGILRAKICASEWTSRAPLPNEVSLARDIGVSIGTVRKALEMLENEHLIHRRQGRGTFVIDTSDETELERFCNQVNGSKKLRADAPLWSCTDAEATREEALLLMLRPSTPVHRVESVWAAGDMLAAYECITVERARFPDLQTHIAESGQYLFPLYRRYYQEVIGKVTESLSAVNADTVLATKLRVTNGQALLCVERIAYALPGMPIELSRRTMHMPRAVYKVTMT